MKNYSYQAVTAALSRQIDLCIEMSGSGTQDPAMRQIWWAQANGAFHFWDALTMGSQVAGDHQRFLVQITDALGSVSDD